MALVVEDIINLRNGSAPTNLELIRDMTLGQDVWLKQFMSHYLDQFLPSGGSKVKVLVGQEGSGKTHLLRFIQQAANERKYATVFISARTAGPKLCDVPNLYRLISSAIDFDQLVTGLSQRIAESMGYGSTIYDGLKNYCPMLLRKDMEHLIQPERSASPLPGC